MNSMKTSAKSSNSRRRLTTHSTTMVTTLLTLPTLIIESRVSKSSLRSTETATIFLRMSIINPLDVALLLETIVA